MGHMIWLPKPPPRGCNIQAHNPDGPISDICVHEGWRLSLDVDVWTHQTAKQDVQAASAALLEGEEKRTPSISSEQAAAPGTPSTSNMQVAQAPLLKGEELWGMATSSEQAAVPATPSTLKSLPIMPANSEATPQPCRHPCTCAPKPSCITHNFQSGRVVYPGLVGQG